MTKQATTTLASIITDLLMNGVDRGALVQPATAESPVGVCVLLLSPVAIQRLGPPLIELMRELGDSPQVEIGSITLNSPIADAFAIAEKGRHGWSWCEMEFGGLKSIAVLFSGAPCERVAAICNQHGAPCSLDRRKSAPGYDTVPVLPLASTDYHPEPLAALQARFTAAVDHVHLYESDVSGRSIPVARQPEHVFDFENGVRLIVSIDDTGDGAPLLHVSGSARPDSPCGGPTPPVKEWADWEELLLEHFGDLDPRPGVRRPAEKLITEQKKAVHFWFPWNASEERSFWK